MAIQIGQRPDHDFHEPLGLLSDCHRRIEHFLRVFIAVDSVHTAEVTLGNVGNASSVYDDEMTDAMSSHFGTRCSGWFATVNRDDANGHDVS
jgi:hypothetical protein